jgi:hypothetical protein
VTFRITHVTYDVFIMNTFSSLKIEKNKKNVIQLFDFFFLPHTTFILRLQVDLRLVVICHSISKER